MSQLWLRVVRAAAIANTVTSAVTAATRRTAASISMPRGPKGEKRYADTVGNAVMIATGEIEDITTKDGKNAAAVALGRMGGKARAAGMTAKRRKEIAKLAAAKRWQG